MSSRFLSRAQRARELADSGRLRIDGDSIVVPSSDGQREYRVRLIGDRVACQCEDHRRGNKCYHVQAAELWAAQQTVPV